MPKSKDQKKLWVKNGLSVPRDYDSHDLDYRDVSADDSVGFSFQMLVAEKE